MRGSKAKQNVTFFMLTIAHEREKNREKNIKSWEERDASDRKIKIFR